MHKKDQQWTDLRKEKKHHGSQHLTKTINLERKSDSNMVSDTEVLIVFKNLLTWSTGQFQIIILLKQR